MNESRHQDSNDLVRMARALPVRIDAPYDPLGLVGHERIREATAELVFTQFDHVAATIIAAEPDVRASFVGNDLVTVAKFSPDQFHSFDVSRSEDEDSVRYTVTRTDIGGEGNGFIIVRRGNGSVLLRLTDLETFPPESDDFALALVHAKQFVQALAGSRNITLPANRPAELVTTDVFRAKMAKEHKRHTSFVGKVQHGAEFIKNTAVDAVKRVATNEDEIGDRKLAFGRLALIAAVMPVPGFSSRIVEDVPIPRPASIEVAAKSFHAIFDNTPTVEQLERDTFRESNIGLPAAAMLAIDGKASEIMQSADLPRGIQYAKTVDVTTFDETQTLDGTAPLRLDLAGQLRASACVSAEIDPEHQTGQYSLLGTTEVDVVDLEVVADRQELKICNTRDGMLILDDKTLYFDIQ